MLSESGRCLSHGSSILLTIGVNYFICVTTGTDASTRTRAHQTYGEREQRTRSGLQEHPCEIDATKAGEAGARKPLISVNSHPSGWKLPRWLSTAAMPALPTRE